MLDNIASNLIRVESDNLVERPWGGRWLRRFKGLVADASFVGPRFGEAFEISAFDADDEARRFPSRVRFDTGEYVELPDLLARDGAGILGERFVARYGSCFPLLPKTLDVRELLSVQGHPRGNTEVYIIIEAEPGASLRLGFSRDMDPSALREELLAGLEQQDELVSLVSNGTDPSDLQVVIAPWFADRERPVAAISTWLAEVFAAECARASALLDDLKRLYWRMLDSMNAIVVEPGQVIYNATPERLLPAGDALASAEVHALGNPEGKEILALEIRRPGPTFRAWDNVRFPRRAVDVDAAIESLNLRATRPEEFLAERRPMPGNDGAFVSVEGQGFRVEHLIPDSGRPVAVTSHGPHSLHCISGAVEAYAPGGRSIGRLAKGESALVPAGVGDYRLEAPATAEVIRVTVPND